MDDFLYELLDIKHPSLRTLIIALKCYRELRKDPNLNLGKLAGSLKGLSRDMIYRALDDFRTNVRNAEGVFQLSPGRGANDLGPASDRLFGQLEEMLRSYAHLQQSEGSRVLHIRIGAALSLHAWVVPQVLRSFRESHPPTPFEDFEIELKHDFPEPLRERGCGAGQFDLVLTACPYNMQWEEDVYRDADVRLQMYLIFPSESVLAREAGKGPIEPDQLKDLLARDWTVVLLTANRDPMPKYPLKMLPESVRVIRVESQPQIHSLVMAGGKVAAFSFPQLFSVEERRLLDAVRLKDVEPVRLCLLRPRRAKERRTLEENELIDQLADRFLDLLQGFKKYSSDTPHPASGSWSIAHLSTAGEGRAADRQWARGTIELQVTEDGFLKGKHTMDLRRRDGGSQRFTFSTFGNIVYNHTEARKERCHLTWRATRPDGERRGEDALVSIVCQRADLEQGPLIGLWTGRQSSPDDPLAFHPSAGYVVLSRRWLPDDRLTQLVRAYLNEHALRLPDPEQILPGPLGPTN